MARPGGGTGRACKPGLTKGGRLTDASLLTLPSASPDAGPHPAPAFSSREGRSKHCSAPSLLGKVSRARRVTKGPGRSALGGGGRGSLTFHTDAPRSLATRHLEPPQPTRPTPQPSPLRGPGRGYRSARTPGSLPDEGTARPKDLRDRGDAPTPPHPPAGSPVRRGRGAPTHARRVPSDALAEGRSALGVEGRRVGSDAMFRIVSWSSHRQRSKQTMQRLKSS